MTYRRNIKLLAWHTFFTDFILWAPLAIIYFSQVSGSYALGLSIFSATMLSSAIFELPTGILSDYIGRKYTLVLGSVFYVLAFIAYALGFSYFVLILGAICEGLARSFYSGNNDALLYDSLAKENKLDELEEYSGKIGSMSQWALAVSGLLGGVVAYFNFQIILWISIVPQIICLILGLLLVEVKEVSKEDDNIFNHIKTSLLNFKNNNKLRWLSISGILSWGMSEAGWQFRSAFIASVWPVWAIGIAQVLSNIGAALSFHFSGKLIKKFEAFFLLLTGKLYGIVSSLIALIFPSAFSPILMSSSSVFFGVTSTARSTLMMREFTEKQRATMGSLDSLASKIFFAIFAVFLGSVADKTSPAKALIMMHLLSLSVLFIYFKLFKKHGRKSQSLFDTAQVSS